jgi:general secretion pathway protein G
MFKKLSDRKRGSAEGFTLIELLIVIVILGILAAIVVFAVGGISDKGQTSSCKADRKTLITAEEAYFAEQGAGNGDYGEETDLVDADFLAETSELHDITLTTDGYTVDPVGPC